MRVLSAFLFYLSIDIARSTLDYVQHPVKSCHIGDVVENECNKCLCTSKAVFECKPLDCNKNKNYIASEASRQLCYPNQLYVQNLITCICTKDGRWPHNSCYDTFQSLPPGNVVKYSCEPETYVSMDCNVCRCGPDGEIDRDRCTRNMCEDESKRRANSRPSSVYSSCEVNNWYSLAPCQFCYCIKLNKLVCNTGNYYSKRLELGSYSLMECGKELIKEAIELIHDNQKTLRLGSAKINESAPIKILTSTTTHHNIPIDVNRESNENGSISSKPLKLDKPNSKEEYYSDTEYESSQLKQSPVSNKFVTSAQITMTPQPQESKGLSTKFPFVEGDEMLIESEQSTDEENDNDSDEVKVDATPVYYSDKPAAGLFHAVQDGQSEESEQYGGNTIKVDLPQMLNKVFQLALRKSMVSLNKKSKCVPGSTSMSHCNMCFCLKNGKLLCTSNKCEEH